MFTLYQVYQLA